MIGTQKIYARIRQDLATLQNPLELTMEDAFRRLYGDQVQLVHFQHCWGPFLESLAPPDPDEKPDADVADDKPKTRRKTR